MPSTKIAPPNKGAVRALDRKYIFKGHETLGQIQNNFTYFPHKALVQN